LVCRANWHAQILTGLVSSAQSSFPSCSKVLLLFFLGVAEELLLEVAFLAKTSTLDLHLFVSSFSVFIYSHINDIYVQYFSWWLGIALHLRRKSIMAHRLRKSSTTPRGSCWNVVQPGVILPPQSLGRQRSYYRFVTTNTKMQPRKINDLLCISLV
jgi:hypothetical protein